MSSSRGWGGGAQPCKEGSLATPPRLQLAAEGGEGDRQAVGPEIYAPLTAAPLLEVAMGLDLGVACKGSRSGVWMPTGLSSKQVASPPPPHSR